MEQITVLHAEKATVQEMDWGRLTWLASGALGNSGEMTVGRCEILPGCANPRHYHPNCEEVLHVLQGRIAHTGPEGTEVELREGDTITIPAGQVHNARNLGNTVAVLAITFSSPYRETIGE